jgi:ABC-type antimicrobial peptide transport system permease subunit
MYFQPDFGERSLSLAIRTTTAPADFTASLREVIQRIDPAQPVFNVRSMDRILETNTERPRVQTTVLTSFAALALLLAAAGVSGAVAFTVERGTKELALRLALGATPAQAMRNAAREGLIASCIGLVLGLIGAWGLNQSLASLLFQIRPDDPLTFSAVATTLVSVTIIACWLPARRATRIHPAVALQQE